MRQQRGADCPLSELDFNLGHPNPSNGVEHARCERASAASSIAVGSRQAQFAASPGTGSLPPAAQLLPLPLPIDLPNGHAIRELRFPSPGSPKAGGAEANLPSVGLDLEPRSQPLSRPIPGGPKRERWSGGLGN